MKRLFLYIVALLAALFINISLAHAVPFVILNHGDWTNAVQQDGDLDISKTNFGSLQFSGDSSFQLLNTRSLWHPAGGVWLPRPQWPLFLYTLPGTIVEHAEIGGVDVLCIQGTTGPGELLLYLPESTTGVWLAAATSWPSIGYIEVRNSLGFGSAVETFWPGTMGMGAGNQWGVYDSQLLAAGDYYNALAIGTGQAGVATCIAMVELAGGPRSAPPAWP